uniref:Coiled-coil domain containing 141 n=1 Tax=Paramormyrops kingsleyae TaxID=1676925 RepID=A0A3B3QG90_9TELE
MSHEGELGGQVASTAISSVAVQAGGSRITVAVLQCGSLLQLRLAESEPDLLEIGNSQEDTQRILEEHEQLLIKLKKHEGSVRGLLQEADWTMEEGAEPKLHEPMASSLSQAWKELVAQLDTRRDLLQLAVCFYDRALEFAVKIDEAEKLQQGIHVSHCSCSLCSCLLLPGLLKTSLLALNSSQELLNFLQHSCSKEKLLRPGSMRRAHSSCTKVENLLEILQDRRRQVDERMRQQQHHLESVLHVRLWEQQEQEVSGGYLAVIRLLFWVTDKHYFIILDLLQLALGLYCIQKIDPYEPEQRKILHIITLSLNSAQMAGVLGYIQVDSFSGECQAYRDLAEKKLQLMSSIEELIYKVGHVRKAYAISTPLLTCINFCQASEKHKLDVKAAVYQVEKIMEELTKKKAILMDLWTSWQLQVNQIKSVKKQWKKFKEQLKKNIHDLKMLEDVLAPGSKMDLGSDLTTVTNLQENFSLAKPQFLQLNAEVEHTLKISELLPLRGASVKEKNEKVTELLHVHQQVKDKIKEYEVVLCKAVRFLQLYRDLDCVPSAVPVTVLPDASQARVQLEQYQEKRAHICYLYKQAISLGAEVATIVCQSVSPTLCPHPPPTNLMFFKVHGKLLIFCLICFLIKFRDSFKDLKKKFNNLKFNYMKRNEKIRNIKGVKNQSQQIERYMEKLQAFTVKEMEDVVNELQRQLGDFYRTMEEFKTNLEMTANLHLVVEEYQFWSDEASATIMRVGKYSSECKTKEAVSMLYKQFEKFFWPTVPQQEERIQQIKELAIRLLGPEEGKKFAEKTVSKHSEIVDSIKELCKGLMNLETNLQVKEFCMPEEQKKEHEEPESLGSFSPQGEVPHSAEEIMCPDASEHASLPPMGEVTCATEGDLLTEEYLFNDEYECPSPDDISLPPLSETPESNMVQSENEDGMCSRSPHASQQGLFQLHSQLSDGAPQRQGWVLSQDEGQSRFRVESSSFVHSPLTVPAPSLVSSTLSSILRTRLPPPPSPAPGTLSECQQTLYAMHKSFMHMQECVHVGASPSDMHVPPSPLMDPGPCRPAIFREEVRLLSGSQAIPDLLGQAPNFSKLLSNAKVMEGSPVTLEVEVMGSPEPTLTWWEAYNEQAS